MTATEELCQLLDERGVEWRLVNGDCILWTDADGATYSARDGFTFAGPDGTVTVYSMAPEQAVSATLGPGTCHIKALRELVRDVVLLAGIAGCDVAGMQIHVHGGDWRTVRERMEELGV